MNLWDFEKYADLPAVLTEDGKEYCYKEINLLKQELSRQIRLHALVLISADNDLGGLIGYLTCITHDSVPILLPPEKENANFICIMRHYEPDYLWLSESRYSKMKQQMDIGFENRFSFLGYILLQKRERKETILYSKLALLLPTSGSTGNPKLVRISVTNIVANTKSISKYLSLTEKDRAIMFLPMSYTYGLSVINTHLFVGGSIVLTKAKIIQRRFWKLVKKCHVTFLAGVPYTFECMKKIQADRLELKDLHILTQAGGRLSEEQQQFWGRYAKEAGKEFYIMYGQTEATARISYLPSENCLRKIGSVGIPVPGSSIWIEDENHQKIHLPKKEGEIVCMGEQVSLGYAESQEDLALADQNKGILLTGDLGYLDEEGYLYITGRKNRFAKIFGKRIDLNALEQLAKECFDGEVTALSDDKKIYLYTNTDVTDNELGKIRNYLPFSVDVFEIRSMETIPRKSSGKIDYRGKNNVY